MAHQVPHTSLILHKFVGTVGITVEDAGERVGYACGVKHRPRGVYINIKETVAQAASHFGSKA